MDEDVRFILQNAVLAPSADNNQPWRFLVREYGRSVEIWEHLERLDPFYIATFGEASLLAIGALIENMAVAASTRGCRLDIDLFPENGQVRHVATVTLERDPSISPDPLFAAIPRRHTNRTAYRTEPLTNADRDALAGAAREAPELAILVEDRTRIARITRAATRYEQLLFSNRQMHGYFFRTIKWSAESAQNEGGLPFETLESPRATRPFFRLLAYWGVARILKLFGLPRIVASRQARIYGAAAAVMGFCLHERRPSDLIRTGRAIERTWLAATLAGLEVQPIAGIPVLREYLKRGPDMVFSPREAAGIIGAYEEMVRAVDIPRGQEAAFFLRLGRGKSPAGLTPRLPIEQVIAEASA